MTQVLRSGSPVSVQLTTNESVTVPTGEVWHVSLSVGQNNAGDETVGYELNGNEILFNSNTNNDSGTNYFAPTYVLDSGDTISVDRSSTAVWIQGYDVSGVVDNPVISQQGKNEGTTDGINISVPDGEIWDVYVTVGANKTGDENYGVYLGGNDDYEISWQNEGHLPFHNGMTLVGGDEFNDNRDWTTLHVQGFEVSD